MDYNQPQKNQFHHHQFRSFAAYYSSVEQLPFAFLAVLHFLIAAM
jgi:hypothetical protein